jgi:hypothetical protein
MTWLKSERQKRVRSNASEQRKTIILKNRKPGLRVVATSEKEEAEIPPSPNAA